MKVGTQFKTLDHLLNKIHHADCLDFMKQLPDKCIDLVLTDPPYGIGESSNNNKSRGKLTQAKDYGLKDWDDFAPSKEVFDEIMRVSKNQIIFGANHFIDKIPYPSSSWIVWDKVNYGNDFADCELAWTSHKSAVRKFEFQWNGMLQGDMKNKEIRIHPTQKPRQLFVMILEKYAEKGQLVFDMFSGSGTTALACHDLGLDFICVEKDADYHAASVKRLEQHQRQGKLF